MNRNERNVLLVLLFLLLLGLFFWRFMPGHPSPVLPPPEIKASSTTVVAPVVIPTPKAPTKSSLPVTSPTGAPIPPKLELHKELIPKNIEIVRCYYTQQVAPPGTTFGFDINGLGFTSEFEKMIKV